MLESVYTHPASLARLNSTPLGPHLPCFIGVLIGLGYARSTLRLQCRVLFAFSRWLAKKLLGVVDLSESGIAHFIFEDRRRGHHRPAAVAIPTLRRFLDHLRGKGLVPPPPVHDADTPLTALLRRYQQHLLKERGLAPATFERRASFLRDFLIERFGEGPVRLLELAPVDITREVLRHAHAGSPATARLMVDALRSFFRFLYQHGEIAIDLAGAVPTVPAWRLAPVPKYIAPEEVERLLDSCDRSQPTGRRDYALLVLLARLGLRTGEVAALTLEDIDWRASELTVRGKGLVHARLPLPKDVGEALVAYLRDGRVGPSRHVFLRTRAPRGPLCHPSSISTIVRRAAQRAGLDPPLKGVYLLRHSLATGMLRRGATLSEIGELLRHRSPNSTEIYAKVDVTGLRALAQPWPELGAPTTPGAVEELRLLARPWPTLGGAR